MRALMFLAAIGCHDVLEPGVDTDEPEGDPDWSEGCRGCGSSTDTAVETTDAERVILVLTFDADGAAPVPQGPVAGMFYVDTWRIGDVLDSGTPVEGAAPTWRSSIDVLSLPTNGAELQFSSSTWEVPLGPNGSESFVVVGFLDTNGNADPTDPRPDAGDPTTGVAADCTFEVEPRGSTVVRLALGL